jgi:hypothetical protein
VGDVGYGEGIWVGNHRDERDDLPQGEWRHNMPAMVEVLPDVNEYGHLNISPAVARGGDDVGNSTSDGSSDGSSGGSSGGSSSSDGSISSDGSSSSDNSSNGGGVIAGEIPVYFQVAATRDYWALQSLENLDLPKDRRELAAVCSESEGVLKRRAAEDMTCSALEDILPKAEGAPFEWAVVPYLTAVHARESATSFVLEPCVV